MSLLVTCDTGGWKTPTRLRHRLADGLPEVKSARSHEDPLAGQGIDRAAYLAARKFALFSGCDLIANEFRSDLIDVGRSLHHQSLFRATVRDLPPETKTAIVDDIYHPYRRQVEQRIVELLKSWSYVVHLSVRTYDAKTTDGKWRRGDVGLLYDPGRADEVDWCLDLIDELYEALPNLKVRRNHPRRGTNDSLTKAMRSAFSPEVYLGIEITLNRAWVARPVLRRESVLDGIGKAIGNLTGEPIDSPVEATQRAA